MWYETIKRTIDVLGAIALLVLFSPILIISVIAIKLTSKGPIFADTPKRVGKDSKPFYAYKLRSMIANAHNLQFSDPKYKKVLKEKQSAGNYKVKNDPRVTPVGKILRRHSIDEIPQLLNVLKGEMSIVGPRPYYADELTYQAKVFKGTKKYISQMQKVRPGITGYWQVSGRSGVTFDKRIKMDAYYANKRSIFLDILIMLKTPWVMLSGKGAM
jgi:exopolysaccharide production protein ExoY